MILTSSLNIKSYAKTQSGAAGVHDRLEGLTTGISHDEQNVV